MFRKCALPLALTGLLAGCATSPSSPSSDALFHDTLVVPNKRIGPALIRMTGEEMVRWLGRPDRVVGSGDGAYRYSREGLQVAFDGERAYAICITKPGYATADGVAVGDNATGLIARWGAPTETRDATRCAGHNCEFRLGLRHHCFANGMQADIDAGTNLITELGVHDGGCHNP